ncbi:carbonic anhydrase [Entomohabitans teleogrylli]|uniref:carbonic anhydrase n=1 Tax=Entomohabitans teleogrylli TaxID=1384589 RepID=UPI000A559124|nr:carbonic anhydrase family protein [Entomohabitans teleogrylli]
MKLRVLMVSALLATASLNAQASEHPAWSYDGNGSPEHWAELSPEYSQCQTGANQSPINITAALKTNLEPLNLRFMELPLKEVNNGHTIQVADKGGDILTLDNQTFELQQFHFHTPSENTIEGRSFPLEAHFVHQNATGEIAVVAVMFRPGEENKELSKLWQHMPASAGSETAISQKIDLKGLFPKEMSYYRFSGSLTTPPCTEGVRWIVMKQPVTVSEQQVKQFAAVMRHPNNRPVQPAHGRVVVE